MPNTFSHLAHQRRACQPTLAHTVHYHVHKPLKWLSAATYVAGATLEHWTVFGAAAAVFIVIHLTTWALAE